MSKNVQTEIHSGFFCGREAVGTRSGSARWLHAIVHHTSSESASSHQVKKTKKTKLLCIRCSSTGSLIDRLMPHVATLDFLQISSSTRLINFVYTCPGHKVQAREHSIDLSDDHSLVHVTASIYTVCIYTYR